MTRLNRRRTMIAFAIVLFLAMLTVSSLIPSLQPLEAGSGDWSARMNYSNLNLIPRLACPDADHCWVTVTWENSSLAQQTCDGGLSWHPWYVPDIYAQAGAAFVDSEFGYVYGTGSLAGEFSSSKGPAGILRTRDGGKTWKKLTDKPAYSVITLNHNVAFASFGDGFNKTTDGGDSWVFWTKETLPDRFLDENIAWRVIRYGYDPQPPNLSFTVDGGKTWTAVLPDETRKPGITAVFFLDYLNGWIGDSIGRVYRTHNAGQSWELIREPPPKNIQEIGQLLFLDEHVGYMVRWSGNQPGVQRTDDGGYTWTYDGAYGAKTLSMVSQEVGWAGGVGYVWKRSPGIAATPTLTPTGTPTRFATTPTNTPTPFLPPVPSGTVVATPMPTVTPTSTTVESPVSICIPPWIQQPSSSTAYTPTPITATPTRTATPLLTPTPTRTPAPASIQIRTEVVRALYLAILARDPDPGGLRSWTNSNLDTLGLITALSSSSEGQRVLAVRNAYIDIWGRDPLGIDNPGLRGWVDSFLSIDEIRLTFLQSDEYRQRGRG